MSGLRALAGCKEGGDGMYRIMALRAGLAVESRVEPEQVRKGTQTDPACLYCCHQ